MHIVFGGSFNPPTKAHVHMVKHLLDVFEHSKVIVVPVGDDYRKPELVSFTSRMDMLKLAFKDNDRVILSSIEAKRGYQGTLKTLNELKETYDDLHFVIGSDNLSGLRSWIQYETLLNTYPFIVIEREGYLTMNEAEKMYEDVKHHFIFIPFDYPISSTQIRKNRDQLKHMLDPDVYDYIKKHQLYEVNKHV
jgi:nicotinate-nucleotide adenylyltransferase